jgi:hypothetical protein
MNSHPEMNDVPQERHVLEIDGIPNSEHRVFIDALRAGLLLKQQFPRSTVKLHDAFEKPPSPH